MIFIESEFIAYFIFHKLWKWILPPPPHPLPPHKDGLNTNRDMAYS